MVKIHSYSHENGRTVELCNCIIQMLTDELSVFVAGNTRFPESREGHWRISYSTHLQV